MDFNKTSGKAILDIPLMNPGDYITISAMAKTTEIDFEVSARIAGVKSLEVIKKYAKNIPDISTPWTVYPVGFFTILLFLSTFHGIKKIPAEFRNKKLIRENKFVIPELKTKNQFLKWIDSKFWFATTMDKEKLIKYVSNLPDSHNFSTTYKREISDNLHMIYEHSISVVFVVIFAEMLVLLGAWYVFSNI